MANVFDIFRRLEQQRASEPVLPVSHLVVGLGNTGREYVHTRHNTGFLCLDEVCRHWNTATDRAKFRSLVGEAVIAGARPIPEQPVPVPAAPRRVNLIVDIRERLRSGKGTAYARWAKVYNLKQMAAALQFMQEQNITEYDQLSAKAEDAVSRFHALTEQLRRTEADLSATSELMGAVVRYAKTRPVFDGYKAAKYSRKYHAEHEAELADYRAAKATMGELLGGEKLPKMAELKEKRRQLAAQKKALYTEYRSAQEEMRQAVAVKANIDHLLGVTDGQRKKEQER